VQINTAQGSVSAPVVIIEGAGKSKGKGKRHRYIARYRGEDHEFSTLQELEEFVEQAKIAQADLPKRNRAPIKIKLAEPFVETVKPTVSIPTRLGEMPQSAALAFIRKLEKEMRDKTVDDQEEDSLLALLL
jgi:hypothetical protein